MHPYLILFDVVVELPLQCDRLCTVCLSSGGEASFNVSEIAERVNVLKKEIAVLENEEQQVDQDQVIVDHCIKQITKDLFHQK